MWQGEWLECAQPASARAVENPKELSVVNKLDVVDASWVFVRPNPMRQPISSGSVSFDPDGSKLKPNAPTQTDLGMFFHPFRVRSLMAGS